jgi:hypothetical protein
VALLVDENVFASLCHSLRNSVPPLDHHMHQYPPPDRSNLLLELLAGLARNEFPSGPNSSLWLYERP